MPGKKKGPGKWIENRADRILDKDLKSRYGNEAKSVAFAIATQQAHKLEKTPKKGKGPGGMYGTKEGKREARAKYDKPKKEYRKTASMPAWALPAGVAALGGSIGAAYDDENRVRGGLTGAAIGALGGEGARRVNAVVQGLKGMAEQGLGRLKNMEDLTQQGLNQMSRMEEHAISSTGGLNRLEAMAQRGSETLGKVEDLARTGTETLDKLRSFSPGGLLSRFKGAEDRCWKGYEPVPGKKPYSDGSCRPVGGKKKSALDRLREKMASVEYRGETFPGYNKPKNAPAGSEKKKVVLAKKGDKVKKVSFGQRGYKHNYSEEAKKSYLARSAGIKGKDDKFSANYWSRKHLWPKGEKADGTAKDQEKKAAVGNLTGRDNRSPFIGGTQFPTESAKQPAQQKLDESIDVAEAGPAPLTPKARTNYSKTMDQATKIPGGWTLPSPQEKTAMDAITKYLTKTAAGRQELVKHAKALETNEKDLKRMDMPKPMKTGPAHPADDAVARGKRDTDEKLKELFSHYPTEKAVIS